MAGLPNEIGENLLDAIVNLNTTSSNASGDTGASNNVLLNHLLDLDTDSEFDDIKTSQHDDVGHCKGILWQPVHDGSTVRTWDLLILIPNVIFLIILVTGMRNARQKLQTTHSPIFGAFYSLVITNTVVSVIRCLVSMAFSAYPDTPGSSVASNADKFLWIVLRFFLMATEMSVVVFGVASGHLDSKRSIQRVVLVSACVSFAYSLSQCVLEFHNDLDLTFDVADGKLRLFGHGGSLFWMVSSLIFALLYLLLVLLPILPCRTLLSLPNKKTFYYYVGFMTILNSLQWAGSLELVCGFSYGLCLVNLTTYLYFTSYTPIVYFTFLGPFFKTNQQAPAFSYKAQLDDFEEEMVNSNSLQFSLGLGGHTEQNPNPIIINGYQRLDKGADDVTGSAFPADA